MKMTKRFKRLLCGCLAGILSVSIAAQAQDKVGFDVGADFYSKYVWRGQLLNDDPVFQPSVGISWGGLTASIWGNMDFTDYTGNQQEFTEYDYSIDYSGPVPGVDWLSFSAGAIFYYFPSLDAETAEVYLGLAVDAPLSPSITVYRDIDEIDGTYVAFGLGHSIEKLFDLGPEMPVGMEIGASVGWGDSDYNKGYWGVSGSRANDLTVSVCFPFELAGWTVCPSVNYVTLLSGSLRESDTYSKESDHLFAGIGLSRSF